MEIGTNKNPKIFEKTNFVDEQRLKQEQDNNIVDEIDNLEIFDLIRQIPDPEHPMSLEELGVLNLDDIFVDHELQEITVKFSPTVPNCSSASLIGLFIKIKLIRSISKSYLVEVLVKEGMHSSEQEINKQLNDKERVAAALENRTILSSINETLRKSESPLDLKNFTFNN